MTLAASARGRSNRRKGAAAELAVAKYLRTVGFGGAERAVVTGYRTPDRTRQDPGDITGIIGVVISVKDAEVERLAKWLAELDDMSANPDDVKLLVHKRRGHANPGEWWCWLRFHDLVQLADDAESGFAFPVRAELADVVMVLHSAGYGTPAEEAAS